MITAGIGTAVVAFATLLAPVAAHAVTQPPWEPDANAAGTMSFFDASGNAVTSGLITDVPFAKYAVGSALPRAGDTKAILEYAQPNPDAANTANWSVASISALATTFPVPAGGGVPTSISSLDGSHPVVTEAANDTSLQGDIYSLPNTAPGGDTFDGAVGCAYETVANNPSTCTNTDYQNLYQLRLITTDGTDNSTVYDDADILVNPTTGGWSQVYPAPAVASNTTTTTLTTNPVTSTTQGTSVALTASIVASDSSSPAGSVQFKDGTTNLGSAVTVDTGTETAQLTVPTTGSGSPDLAPGTHSLTAIFTPTDTVDYSGSTSDPVSFLVNPQASVPTISGTAQVGKQLTCNEATTLGEATSFEWKLNGSNAASGRTYTLPASAVKKSVTCTATVTVSGGTPSSATSTGKTVALGAALKASKKPALSGAGKVGKTETVSHGSWKPSASSYTYQWLLNGKSIKHATKSSYKLIKKDKGKKISCTVTAKKAGYASGKATSKSVKVKG